jgi:hypothetical protein
MKEVTRYQTADGKEFKTEKQAAEHIESMIKGAFKKALMSSEVCRNVDAFTLVEALYEHRAFIYNALNFEE